MAGMKHSRQLLSSLTLVLLILLLSIWGCAPSTTGSPELYGQLGSESKPSDTTVGTDTTGQSDSASVASGAAAATTSATSGSLLELLVAGDSAAKAPDSSTRATEASVPAGGLAEPDIQRDLFYSAVDVDDSASAVDDEIWRQLDLAAEYHSMGVIANREASWEEAQYYFEKALRILANLDIESGEEDQVETDSLFSPEAVQYNNVLSNVIADYRVTLRSLGTLDDDASASVLVERFGDLASGLKDDSLVVFQQEEHAVTYDLPVVMNDRVRKSIVYYQTVGREVFEKFLRRSERYTGMMTEIIRSYGLPEDLIYLSMVESGYNPHAYSWARAMGLWQFIASTGRLYKLDRDWWIDERKDPIKSTHAACRFLRDLHKEFDDWELAMAAYNGGPGRVRSTIRKQGTRDFWKLRLRRQTMDYVPLIMAAAIIAKNPEKYGFYNIEAEPPIVWDTVTIDRCLELSLIAKEIGCSTEELADLNPELLRKFTPPNSKDYLLKVPVGKREQFLAVYDGLPSPKETSWVQHEIRRGETVSSIAARYGVSQYAILEANNMTTRSKIYAGKSLIVPVPMDREYPASQPRDREYEARNSIYVVRSGDTMWDIARAFGTTVQDLRSMNYIERGSRIYVGQKLKIPGSASKLQEKTSPEREPETYASKPPAATGGAKTYKVRPGDTLWDIARQLGTTTSKIRQLNSLGRTSRIYPGQVLTVEANDEYVVHQVKRGETLGVIAAKYRTSVARIRASNNIDDPDRLNVGQSLIIHMSN